MTNLTNEWIRIWFHFSNHGWKTFIRWPKSSAKINYSTLGELFGCMEFTTKYILLLSVNCVIKSSLSSKFMACTLVYKFFPPEEQIVKHLPVYHQMGRTGKGEGKEFKTKGRRTIFIWFSSLPSASSCRGIFYVHVRPQVFMPNGSNETPTPAPTKN